ncbi:hypothetical protein ES288_A11G056100v1 [Gossypium darwinii]|uniref:Uncharacterized protein n=1 Tax=Gossypium darwinii TaxID=34276 RepID=A0A5D2EHN0_GOSDA|nr:hypothetical protein ES288_A11G056100v1 [Gossypium darwinii]
MASPSFFFATFLLLLSTVHPKVIAVEQLSDVKLNSRILQIQL